MRLCEILWLNTDYCGGFQCAVNGLTYEKLSTEGGLCENLEVFFSGFPRFFPKISTLFTNLVSACVVGQECLSDIDHLYALQKLEELWVAECKITVSFFDVPSYISNQVCLVVSISGILYHNLGWKQISRIAFFFTYVKKNSQLMCLAID